VPACVSCIVHAKTCRQFSKRPHPSLMVLSFCHSICNWILFIIGLTLRLRCTTNTILQATSIYAYELSATFPKTLNNNTKAHKQPSKDLGLVRICFINIKANMTIGVLFLQYTLIIPELFTSLILNYVPLISSQSSSSGKLLSSLLPSYSVSTCSTSIDVKSTWPLFILPSKVLCSPCFVHLQRL